MKSWNIPGYVEFLFSIDWFHDVFRIISCHSNSIWELYFKCAICARVRLLIAQSCIGYVLYLLTGAEFGLIFFLGGHDIKRISLNQKVIMKSKAYMKSKVW